jgi:hypothetical protein
MREIVAIRNKVPKLISVSQYLHVLLIDLALKS